MFALQIILESIPSEMNIEIAIGWQMKQIRKNYFVCVAMKMFAMKIFGTML